MSEPEHDPDPDLSWLFDRWTIGLSLAVLGVILAPIGMCVGSCARTASETAVRIKLKECEVALNAECRDSVLSLSSGSSADESCPAGTRGEVITESSDRWHLFVLCACIRTPESASSTDEETEP